VNTIVVIKNFAISLPSQPFFGCHLQFHIFFHNGLFGAAPFLQLGYFGLDNVITGAQQVVDEQVALALIDLDDPWI